MTLELSAILNGTEYSLSDETLCKWIGFEGLGMSPFHRLSERGPLQDGDTDRGYRLDPRKIRLILQSVSNTQDDWESKRAILEEIFKPSSTPIILKIVNTGKYQSPNTSTYQLDVHCYAPMDMPSVDMRVWHQRVIVELKANDPTFYDPAGDAYSFTIGGGSNTFVVPFEVPFTIGASTINANEAITNAGNVNAYPTIRITGPIDDCVITNNSTGEKLDFTDVTIAAGHYYDIDLRYGHKTVMDDDGTTNRIADLTDDSDLVSWHLGCDPDVVDGVNSITVTGSSCTEATSINMTWFNRYIGI